MTSTSRFQKLLKAAVILLIIVLAVVILKFGKPFLVPLAFATLFSMLLVPLTRRFEKKMNKALATILSILALVSAAGVVLFFLSAQISELTKDSSKIKEQMSQKHEQVEAYLSEKLGIPPEKQKQMIKEQQSSTSQKGGGMMTGVIKAITGTLTDTIIVLVYVFLMLYFRHHLKRFVLRIVPDVQKENAEDVMNKSQRVMQKYLSGLALMIGSLWIMYSIGFSIVGVKSPVVFAIICGLLEIIPFVGNLLGNALTILFSLAQGADSGVIIGILITYAIIQFFQTYVLEPLVVGSEVSINPLFTIMSLIAAELLWGPPGMILAIPSMGVLKIICDHIDLLKPYGQLIGQDQKESTGLRKKVKEWGKRLINKK